MDLLIHLIGGIGLILLGMRLMSNGLKLAAGSVLRSVLAKWTRTKLKGLLSGFLITSVVQSSGAVTVAIIGFVNAGLVTLREAIWVIYGSNVGTTTTAWIVAFLGLKMNISAFALPLIGVGMGLGLTGQDTRRGALGEALAGFGLFFLGIEVLKTAFEEVGQGLPLEQFVAPGILGGLLFVGVGFVLTSLMQSSSASIALILTAVAGDVVTLNQAAAAVIGANVGSTTTGLLAAIGATPSAKRVAAAHVAFNIITGLGAILLLPVLLEFISWTRSLTETWLTSASILALFHTLFNVLGVLMVWRLTPRLMRFLRRRFRTRAEDRSEPRFLDKAVAKTPAMALNAMLLELDRIGRMARELTVSVLESEHRPIPTLREDAQAIQALHAQVSEFAAHLRHEGLSKEGVDLLPDLFRLLQYYGSATDMISEMDSFLNRAKGQGGEVLARDLRNFMDRTGALVQLADPARKGFSFEELDEAMSDFVVHYKEFKDIILQAGSTGGLAIAEMEEWLEVANHIRHMVNHFSKASKQLHRLLEQRDIDLSSRAVRGPSRG